MRNAIFLTAALLTACASGPELKPEAAAAQARYDADRAVAAKLRSISARARKGERARLREELLAEADTQGAMGKLYLAWIGAPSEEAWQEINRIGKLFSNEPWTRVASGQIYLQWKGFADHADGEFQKALLLRPDFVPALVGRADVLRATGKLAEAKIAYRAVLDQVPDWEEALVGLGLAQLALGEAAGKASLRRALEVDPNDLAAVQVLAKLANEEGDAEAALELNGRMLDFNPGDRAAWIAQGRIRQKQGDLGGAAADYEKAMAIAPDATLAGALAEAYQGLHRPEDEIRVLEKLAQLDVADPAPLLRVAELRSAEKDLEGAEAALRQAAARRPEDGSIYLAIARLSRERDDLIPSIEAYRTAKAKGASEAQAELKELEARAHLPERPIAGDPNRVYDQVFSLLKKQFKARVAEGKAVGGQLHARVTIGDDGRASMVEMVLDTVHDGVLSALVFYSLKDAAYPKKSRTPTFEFQLSSGK